MENKGSTIVKLVVAFGILFAIAGFVSAAGVSAPYWPGNPKIVYPGERGEVSMNIQNMVGEEDLVYQVTLVQNDGEIGDVDAGEYEVPFGTKDTEVVLDYRIPDDAPIGTQYTVRISFDSIISGESSGARIGTGLEITIPFEVQDVEPLESPGLDMSFVWLVIAIVVAVFALVVIIVLVVKRRSSTSMPSQNLPQMTLR